MLWKDGHFALEELARVIPATLIKGKSREVFPDTLPFTLTLPKQEQQ